MNRHKQQQLVDNADVPVDSQFSVLVPRKIRDSISHVKTYGEDMFCVLLDATSYPNPWTCNPALTFLPSYPTEETRIYPVSAFPETRHILGMEADVENRRVVVSHFNYAPTGGKLIKLDIYSVDADFNAKLVRVFSTKTECAGSGVLGSFTSPKVGEFVTLWGDLSNDTFFDTFTATFKDELEVQTDNTRTEMDTCASPFYDLDEVYPGPSLSLYNLKVYAVGGSHSDCIAVRMCQIKLRPEATPKEVFHRVVRLPLPLNNVPETRRSNKNTLYASIVSMVHRDDGSSHALVKAMLQETDEAGPAAITTGDAAPTPRRKFKHLYVFLLLDLGTNAVLDIYIGGLHSVCAIDYAGERIVRFVPVVVEDLPEEAKNRGMRASDQV